MQEDGERNYHIFYMLVDGAPAELKDQLLLRGRRTSTFR
jgi:myosin heavy subunit